MKEAVFYALALCGMFALAMMLETTESTRVRHPCGDFLITERTCE